MITIKKTLVYSFYISPDWEINDTNRIHFACLKSYGRIFDDVRITLLIDDTNDFATLSNVEKYFISILKPNTLSFKIAENNIFREASVFYTEIAKNVNSIEGMVFFAHNKGLTNISSGYNKETIFKWITAMYFLSLEYIDEAVKKLTDERYFAYGSLLDIVNANDKEGTPFLDLGKGNFLYTGTFFWINAGTLSDYLSKAGIEVPKITDRWYAENFLANTVPFKCCTAHEGRYVVDYVGGREYIEFLIKRSLSEDTLAEFERFNDNILVDLGLK